MVRSQERKLKESVYATLSEDRTSRKLFTKLYGFVIMNKDLSYGEFMSKLNKDFPEHISSDLRTSILKSKDKISQTKYVDLVTVYNYMLAKKRKDNDTIEQMQSVIDNIKIRRTEVIRNESEITKQRAAEAKERKLNIISDVIAGKDVDSSELATYDVKKLINKGLSMDDYIEYMGKKNDDVKPINENEIAQCISVLDFFIKNLEKTISEFEQYDLEEDQDKIRNFYVNNEEELDESYANQIGRLKNWKLCQFKNELLKYKKLRELMQRVIDRNGLEKYNEVNFTKKDFFDTEFLYDYYTEIKNIMKLYKNSVYKVSTISDSSNKELQSRFTHKYILGDNE